MSLSRQAMLKQQELLKAIWVGYRRKNFDEFFKAYTDLTQMLDDTFEELRELTDDGKKPPQDKGTKGRVSVAD